MSLLPALAPSLTQAASKPGKHVACPVQGGKDGFRFFKNVAETGGGVCNTCGTFPDGFAVLQWVNAWTFPETLTQVARWLGEAPNPPVSRAVLRPTEGPQDEARRRQRLECVWAETQPDPGRIAAYLRYRGLRGTVPPTLRFHPHFRYFNQAEYPAMIAQVIKADRTVNLHATYLARNADGKASVAKPKQFLPPVTAGATTGGAIHLAQPDRILAITEGIETGLAVWEATSVPVWVAGSATLLAAVEVPPSVTAVQIWADADPAGQQAALKAAQRLSRHGKAVIILDPS